jgi:hypothetical protein
LVVIAMWALWHGSETDLPAIESWKRQRDELQDLLDDYLSGARHEQDFSTGKRVDITPQRIAELEKQIAASDQKIAAAAH